MTLDRMVVPFKAWHLNWLDSRAQLTEQEMQGMEQQNSRTFVVGGHVVAAAGTLQYWPGRHNAWAYMSPATGLHMRWLTREVERELKLLKGRIEMTVLVNFQAGHRWALMLGFSLETPAMKGYAPDGSTHAMYTRFN